MDDIVCKTINLQDVFEELCHEDKYTDFEGVTFEYQVSAYVPADPREDDRPEIGSITDEDVSRCYLNALCIDPSLTWKADECADSIRYWDEQTEPNYKAGG